MQNVEELVKNWVLQNNLKTMCFRSMGKDFNLFFYLEYMTMID